MRKTKQSASAHGLASNLDQRGAQLDQLWEKKLLPNVLQQKEQDRILASVRDIDYQNWRLAITVAAPPPKRLSETRSELASGQFRYLGPTQK